MGNQVVGPSGNSIYNEGAGNIVLKPGDVNKPGIKWCLPEGYGRGENCGLPQRRRRSRQEAEDDPAQYLGAQSVTVIVGAAWPDSHPDTDDASDAFGTLHFGSAGACGPDQQAFDFDLNAAGTKLVFPANDFNLDFQYPTAPLPGGLTQPDVTINVTVGVGPCTDPGFTSAARRTIRVGNILNAQSSAILPIPAFAVSMTIQTATLTGSSLDVKQVTGSTGTIVKSFAAVGVGEARSVPVAAGARFFKVFNNGLAPVENVSVVFHLLF